MSERVFEELLSRILSSELGPDDRVTIDTMSRELGVSQTPLREALNRLAAEGVVVHHHLSGYRVAPKLSRDQFEDLMETRLALEPVAARNAADRMPKELFSELEELNARMAEVLTDSSSDRSYAVFSQLDALFHDRVAAGGRNEYIRDSLARLHTHAHLFRLANHQQITTQAVDEHAELIARLRERDPGEAALVMRDHIRRSAERFRASYD